MRDLRNKEEYELGIRIPYQVVIRDGVNEGEQE
jgi:hypothetical protein